MAFDIFSTAVLNRLLDDRRQPASVLLDLFFPNVEPATRDEIYFDEIDKNRRLAPFVSPLVEGKFVDMPGFKTRVFKPAYVKDKRIFEDTRRFRRRAGEPIGSTRSEVDRREEAIQANLQDQLEMLTRREEWMASSVLRTGAVTVSGDEYPTQVVTFGRTSGHTVALLTTARWGESGVSPLANLNSWRLTAQANGGGALTRVVMDPLAWDLFSKDQAVKDLVTLEASRGNAAPVTEVPYSTYNETSEANVFYHGRLGVYEFYEYQMLYHDENGVEQKMIPDYTVIMGSPARLMGTRCYGMIKDEEANWAANRFFVKSWRQPDPGKRFFLMQSAPLVVPFRPNASFCATVR